MESKEILNLIVKGYELTGSVNLNNEEWNFKLCKARRSKFFFVDLELKNTNEKIFNQFLKDNFINFITKNKLEIKEVKKRNPILESRRL